MRLGQVIDNDTTHTWVVLIGSIYTLLEGKVLVSGYLHQLCLLSLGYEIL